MPIDPIIKKQLEEIVGKKYVLESQEDLLCYSFDGTFAEFMPDLVVEPKSTQEVSDIMKLVNENRIPVIARGMGSGLAAGTIPFGGGIVLPLNRMNRILEIDPENMVATVEAGVITLDLQNEVEKQNLFYPPDPSSNKHSTIGGNIACNAGGPRCLKYGVTGDYVMGLTVVLADGRVIKTGGKTIKNVTGYDFSQLFTGSEGTLGIITEAMLKLVAKPRYVRTSVAEFDRVEDASQTVNAILLAGITPATMELMDNTAIVCIEEAMHLGLPVEKDAIIIIESDGFEDDVVQREIEAIARICRENGATEVKVAKSEAERAELWRARRTVSPSLARRAPNKLGEDISVPRSQIPEAVKRLKEISKKYGLPIVIFGHAGDGNLHPNVLFDKRDPDQWDRVHKMVGEIFAAAVELGGTLSGEHGVGTLKLPYLQSAVGDVSIDVQQSIKRALDPHGILNPGKALPLMEPMTDF
ncbi:MAG: FAD-binding protein [Anaerolineales bacterium]|nr:FAD-binding protein [Anaerolineales bacterium]